MLCLNCIERIIFDQAALLLLFFLGINSEISWVSDKNVSISGSGFRLQEQRIINYNLYFLSRTIQKSSPIIIEDRIIDEDFFLRLDFSNSKKETVSVIRNVSFQFSQNWTELW